MDSQTGNLVRLFSKTPTIVGQTTIYNIPAELVVEVFRMYAISEERPYPPHSESDFSPATTCTVPTYMSWVRLMLVCRQWREIGLRNPSLWRIISVTSNLQALNYRLARSSPCTIALWINDCPTVNTLAMPLLLEEVHRIRSITHTAGLRYSHLSSIEPLFRASLPALERIAFIPRPDYGYSRDDLMPTAYYLGLNETLHPSLKNITACRIVLPHASQFWSKLRTLKVIIDHRRPYADIVSILANAPHLEVLELPATMPLHEHEYMQDWGPGEADSRAPKIVLAKLKRAIVNGPLGFVTTIMQRFEAPTLDVLCIKTGVPPGTDILESMASLFPPTSRHLRVLDALDSLHAFSSDTGLSIQDPGAEKCFVLDFFFQTSSGADSLAYTITALCRAFGTTSLQRLILSGSMETRAAPVTAWSELFATFPALRSLEMQCLPFACTHAALDALSNRAQGGELLDETQYTADVRNDPVLDSLEIVSENTESSLVVHDLIERLLLTVAPLSQRTEATRPVLKVGLTLWWLERWLAESPNAPVDAACACTTVRFTATRGGHGRSEGYMGPLQRRGVNADCGGQKEH
ncbi:hypothetical protein C8Q76DRAFT_421150 [Earliella scabrosa]|nr:hypothetical protein C8Q76DRAFT_421150 [Earliella scabrosa]